MNAKNRKLLITGGSFGLLLGLTFGGLTFADGPVLFQSDVRAPNRMTEFNTTTLTSSFMAGRVRDRLRKARSRELTIATMVILASAVAITCGVACSTQR